VTASASALRSGEVRRVPPGRYRVDPLVALSGFAPITRCMRTQTLQPLIWRAFDPFTVRG
jgi:hypothetical protein